MEDITKKSSFIRTILDMIRGNSKNQEIKKTRIQEHKYKMTKPTVRCYDGSDLF